MFSAAVKPGISDEVLADSAANGRDVSDMLHHGSYGKRDDGDDGGKKQTAVKMAGECEDRILFRDRETEPGCFFNGRKINVASDSCHQI